MSNTMKIGKYSVTLYQYNTVVIGSGAAGLAAANELSRSKNNSFCLITEGMNMGTSRNTGSDKQTYYKLSVAGEAGDSVRQMARDLFAGGCMNGDTALCQAALSARGFFSLVSLGVPFPSNEYGEYVGYKTDHDNTLRAVSAGPLTSRFMVEYLEKEIIRSGIPLYDHYLAVEILTNENTVEGLLVLDTGKLNDLANAFSIFTCKNIILATGGPAGLYRDSVYPPSQTGGSGMAYRAGAAGANLTEWQYGIASTGFRWNLSGSFQQVLPRYFSTGQDGSGEREFLCDSLSNEELLSMTFLKGYQWPFDAKKAQNGSSRIDLAVFKEIQAGRRVFMDFTRNPLEDKFDFSLLSEECRNYLAASNALLNTPIERLLKLNSKAYDVYKNNGYDLKTEPLEICVAAQHNNGGLAVDCDCQTNIKGLYAIGEAAATFGIYRPGGTALNATQVDAIRSVKSISKKGGIPANTKPDESIVLKLIDDCEMLISKEDNSIDFRKNLQKRMSDFGAFVRNPDSIKRALDACRSDMEDYAERSCTDSPLGLPAALQNRDLIITQFVYLSAMLDYIEKGGSGRGSFVVEDEKGLRPFVSGDLADVIQYMEFSAPVCTAKWLPVRPIPDPETWFENVMRKEN